jgi:hypothetical protein
MQAASRIASTATGARRLASSGRDWHRSVTTTTQAGAFLIENGSTAEGGVKAWTVPSSRTTSAATESTTRDRPGSASWSSPM